MGLCKVEPELFQLPSTALGGVRGAETQPQPSPVGGGTGVDRACTGDKGGPWHTGSGTGFRSLMEPLAHTQMFIAEWMDGQVRGAPVI